MWPIGDVGNGDQIILAMSGSRTGEVLHFFRDRERERDRDRDAPQPMPEAPNLTKLADNFDAFVAMQRPNAA